MSQSISELITELEGSNYPFAHKLWDEVTSLSVELQRCASGWLPSDTYETLKCFSNEKVMTRLRAKLVVCV